MDFCRFVYMSPVIKNENIILLTTSGLAVSNTTRDHKLYFAVCTLASRDPGGKGNHIYENLGG